jgi:O-antigen ligase
MKQRAKPMVLYGVEVLCYFLLTGLLTAKASLSIAIACLSVPFLFFAAQNFQDIHLRKMVLALLLFALPAMLSLFWSQDLVYGLQHLLFKLSIPFVFVTVCCLRFAPAATTYRIGWSVVLTIAIAAGYTASDYFMHPQLAVDQYKVAKTLRSLFQNDHTSFSILLCYGFLLLVMLERKNFKTCSLIKKIAILLITGWLIFVLHLLAARAGLFLLYVVLLASVVGLLLSARHRSKGWALLGIVIALLMVGYFSLPTLRKRIEYIRYDYEQYSQNKFLPGSNDGARLLSLQAGWQSWKSAPMLGIGFGDLATATANWYTAHRPEQAANERFLPTSQWLLYLMGAGLFGFACLLIGMGFLVWCTYQEFRSHWLAIGLLALFLSLGVTDAFERQDTSTLFAFFLGLFYLCHHHQLKQTLANK